ncbi:MAG: hypothetical protein R3A12_06045 [Ignavibacteria bacterium]
MIGRHIETLVNNVQGPGIYQVEFNGINFRAEPTSTDWKQVISLKLKECC